MNNLFSISFQTFISDSDFEVGSGKGGEGYEKGGLQIVRYYVCLQRVLTCLQMHRRVQHLQGEIDKSHAKLFHGDNKQNL